MTKQIITRTQIIGTDIAIYEAYEPTSWGFAGAPRHSSITRIDGRTYGRIGTRDLPEELEALPRGEERYELVRAWQRTEDERAYVAIIAAHPSLTNARRSSGSITRQEAQS